MTELSNDDWKGEHLIKIPPRPKPGERRENCYVCGVGLSNGNISGYCVDHRPSDRTGKTYVKRKRNKNV